MSEQARRRPRQFLEQLYTKVDAGHCRRLLGPEQPWSDPAESLGRSARGLGTARRHALGLIYRLDRCYVPDVRALTHLYETFFVPDAERSRLFALSSNVLFWHIAFAEMWEQPAPSTAELEVRIAPLFFSKDLALGNPSHDVWPIYPRDEYMGEFPDTDVPVLMLQGTLDPQTPRDLAVVTTEHFTAPHQTWTLVPGSPHSVATQSYVTTPGADTCGFPDHRELPRRSSDGHALTPVAWRTSRRCRFRSRRRRTSSTWGPTTCGRTPDRNSAFSKPR